jgi:hypothetical protein
MAQFDLFLSHNSKDKAQIEMLAEKLLEDASLRCWLDVWSIPAATDWEQELEQAMQQCGAAAIAIGRSGWGRYHRLEAWAMIQRANREEGFRLLPVLLDGMTPQEVPDEMLRGYFERMQCVSWKGLTDDDAVGRIVGFLQNAGLPPFQEGRPELSPVRVRRDAKLWQAKHDASNLYTGRKLEDARRLSGEYPGQFDDLMLRFLATSERKARQRQRGMILVSSGASLLLAATTAWAVWSRQKAVKNERYAKLNSAVSETFRGRFGQARTILESIPSTDTAVDLSRWVIERHCAYPSEMGNLGIYELTSLTLDPGSGNLLGITARF